MPHLTYQDYHIHYREQGEGDLVILLPGNTASSVCHAGELEYFGRQRHAVALDLIGTGGSDRMAVWPDTWWQDGAHQAAALADHLGKRSFVAMGTSGGAIMALWSAILYPERVRAVVADSTISIFPPELVERNVIQDRAQRLEAQVGFWSFAHGSDWEQVVDADTDLIRRLAECGGDWLEGRWREVQCPVLVTGSLQDSALPGIAADNAAMVTDMPQARLYLHPEGDHPWMWSQAAAFRAQADLFLASIS